MVLNADMLSQLRQSQSDAGFTQTVQYQTQTSGTYGTATNLTVEVYSDVTSEEHDPVSDRRFSVRRIVIRPMSTVSSFQLGDRIIYGGVNFVAIEVGGLEVPRWVCELRTSIGGQGKDRFRAIGG